MYGRVAERFRDRQPNGESVVRVATASIKNPLQPLLEPRDSQSARLNDRI